MPEVKPGIGTTEFWLAVVVTIIGSISAVYSSTQWGQVAGMVCATLASAGYGFSRTVLKK